MISTDNTLFVLLDGMEDDPCPELGGKKPYEAAEMPFIRKAAPNLAWTTGRGYTQLFLNEFWTGHAPDPSTSRAAIEACGLGLDMGHGRTAFRMSPAFIGDGTVKWAYGVDDRADDLMQSVKDNMYLLDDCAPEMKFFVHGRAVITLDYGDYVPEPGPQAPVDGPFVPIAGPMGELVMQVASENEGLTLYPWGHREGRAHLPRLPLRQEDDRYLGQPDRPGNRRHDRAQDPADRGHRRQVPGCPESAQGGERLPPHGRGR
ncbi:MAG: hypothetical protein LKE35_00170 [Candidatus Methanomethylophilus sp.]|nr:hypothetical protein [Methanomethylophilus sp.]